MKLADLILSEGPTSVGLHLVQTDERTLAGLRRTPGQREALVRTIRGRKCLTVPSLFDEMGAALQFPYYFGENWDALDEVLRDLADLAPIVLVLFSNADAVLSNESDAKFATLAVGLSEAHAYWRERDVSFQAVFQCATDAAITSVSARLAASKQAFDILGLT